MNRFLLTVFSVLLFGTLVYSDPGDRQNFFVAPITTELHRAEISDADVFAVVNCQVISLDGTDLSDLNPDELRTQLKQYAADGKALQLIPRYQFPVKHSDAVQKRIKDQLVELAEEAGFKKVKSSTRQTSGDWSEQLRVALAYQDKEGEEPVIETPLLRAYPVNTRLSKFELGEADCVITIIRPIDGRAKDGLPEELTKSIRSAVEQMELPQKKWLKYKLSSTAAGRELVDTLFDARPPPRPPSKPDPFFVDMFNKSMAAYKMSPAFQLALDLGFERIMCSHSPQGGSPELRVGEQAPNFQAVDLDGQNIDFMSFRNGRPALVTFWGVACGPCRAEAPHLTRLHEKHRGKFAIVAVNDYDESRDKVHAYVTKTNLTHPIVLPKGEVASDYGVASHPTTFWIDKDGVVQDFVIGFHSGEDLDERIQALLK